MCSLPCWLVAETSERHSTHQFHRTVKRVVLTSSIGAMANAANEPKETYVGTEDDWNDYGVETVANIGKAAPGVMKYGASKVLAEKGRSQWAEKGHDRTPYQSSWATAHSFFNVSQLRGSSTRTTKRNSPTSSLLSLRGGYSGYVRVSPLHMLDMYY